MVFLGVLIALVGHMLLVWFLIYWRLTGTVCLQRSLSSHFQVEITHLECESYEEVDVCIGDGRIT